MRSSLVLVPLAAALAVPAAEAAQLRRVPAPPSVAGRQDDSADHESFGVLRPIGLLCTAYETDAGELFVLADLGGFEIGDRVRVRGSITSYGGVCGSLVVPILDNTIEAAFAGTGALVLDPVLGIALEVEGARYKLVSPGGFPPQSEVFARGVVRTYDDPGTGTQHWLFDTVIGPAWSGFGRLEGAPGAWTVEAEDGATLNLENPGFAFAEQGEYVFVEGALSFATLPPTLVHNTARPALEAAGEVIDGGGGVPAFQAEGILFDDVFALEDFGGFTIGERAFVRGRMPEDLDPLEPRGNRVRSARIDPEFTACGTVFADLAGSGFADLAGSGFADLAGSGYTFQATSGETFELEFTGAIASEPFLFVSGALDPTLTRFAHNVIHPCSELSGTLQHGFECTPLFVADGGGVFLLENLGPYWIDDWFCVLGGVTACDGGCPAPCVVANAVHDCTQ